MTKKASSGMYKAARTMNDLEKKIQGRPSITDEEGCDTKLPQSEGMNSPTETAEKLADNLSARQFKLMVGQEYELEKMVEGRPSVKDKTKSDTKLRQSVGVNEPTETAEKLAEEHNISSRTVERSADLYKAQQAIEKVAPEVAQKLENEEIKALEKDVRTIFRKVFRLIRLSEFEANLWQPKTSWSSGGWKSLRTLPVRSAKAIKKRNSRTGQLYLWLAGDWFAHGVQPRTIKISGTFVPATPGIL